MTLRKKDVKNTLSSFGQGLFNAQSCLRIWVIAFFCVIPVVFPALAEVTSVPGTVVGDNVNMRVSPGLRSEVVGQLDRGEEVRVLLTDGEWCAIIPPGEMFGWVSSQYVTDGRVSGSRVNVRSGPGVSYGRLTYLRKDTEVDVLEEKAGWVKITLPKTGRLWVSARYIDQSPDDPMPENSFPASDQKREMLPPQASKDIISSGRIEPEVTAVAVPSPSPVPPQDIPGSSSRPVPSESSARSSVARSYSGYIEKLDQPFSTADREYAYELRKERFDSNPVAFLTGDTIDLKKFLSRKVRLWAVIIEKKDRSPDLMEVKGVGMLW